MLFKLQSRSKHPKHLVPELSEAHSAPELDSLPTYQQVIHRLKRIVPELVKNRPKDTSIPVVILTQTDWQSLINTCVRVCSLVLMQCLTR
jgi:hypothetical protein